MIAKEVVEKAVREYIEKTEHIGDRTGGSGHLATVTYEIESISVPKPRMVRGREVYEVQFAYTLTRESEFTVYPDNPPASWGRVGSIVLDEKGLIVELPIS